MSPILCLLLVAAWALACRIGSRRPAVAFWLVVLAACGPSSSPDTAQTVIQVPGGSVAWTPTASRSEIAAGTSQIAPWVAHWGRYAPRGISVTVQRHDELALRDAYRAVGSSQCWLELLPDGTIGGLEWEVPLLAQGVQDPPTWTWGRWGPLYPGQAAWAVAATEGP